MVRDGPRRHRLHDLPLCRGRRRESAADAVPRGLRHAGRRDAQRPRLHPHLRRPAPAVRPDGRAHAGVGRPRWRRAGGRADQRVVRGGADPHRGTLRRRDGATAQPGGRLGDRAGGVRRADLRLPGRQLSVGRFRGRRLGGAAARARMRGPGRCGRRSEGGPGQGLTGEVVRIGSRLAVCGPGRPGLRRPRLHARVRRRTVPARAAGRSHLGRDIGDPAADHRASTRETRRGTGGRMTAEARPGVIDLRPLFAPTSIAVVGASPRSWIAETVRDNLRVMGSATRCHFVNPKYEELHGQPCYPSIEALPETPDIAIVALNPLRAPSVTQAAADAGVPAVVIPGGGVVEGGEAAAAMQLEVAAIAREHGLALLGPNCMGVIDLVSNSATYIGDVSPYLPRGGVAGIAQSGSVSDAFVHSGNRVGFSRIISCGSEVVLDVCDYLAYFLDDPETSAVILFLEGFKRPERFLALADRALELGKPIMAVKVGRSDQAQTAAIAHTGSLAGETRVTDAALDAAGVICCRDLDELLETAALVEGARRTGRRVGRGRTGVVTVSTGEASLIADMAPRTGVDLPPIPNAARAAILEALPSMGYLGNPLDPWGADQPARAYRACFEAMAASDAYDVLVLVHDFPYRSLPAEVQTANVVARQLLAATADRPSVLPIYTSLTSGEPPPETKTVLDDEGGAVPLLRGALEAFRAIAEVARWERRHETRLSSGPWRAAWPSL